MRKFMIATGAAALLTATSFGAFAAEIQAPISSIDAAAGTVTLSSGETLKLPTGYDAAALSVGEQIAVDYDAGTMMIETFEVITDGDVMQETRGDE